MEPIDEISNDLSWRETELALLKVFLQRKDVSRKQHEVLARAAWSLLYAHYEGFSKFCLSLFFDHAARRSSDCHRLPQRTKEFALYHELKRIRSLTSSELLLAIETFSTSSLDGKPTFPDVDTKSNLWPNVLESILETADIRCASIDTHRNLLKALVGKRNGIAHGEFIQANYSDYVASENAVYSVMYELAFEVDSRLKSPPFGVAADPAE